MVGEIQRIQREFDSFPDEKSPQYRKIRADNKNSLNFKEELDKAIEETRKKGGDEF